MADALGDLSALRPLRFTENFLRVNVTQSDVDWFDDFSAIFANAHLTGEMGRSGRARGIVRDVEQYESQLFTYHAQNNAPFRPWVAYAAQAPPHWFERS